ncbi:hypothetical protein BDW75DRAFT_220401 [Aspergillus navahoensis]
MNQSSKYSLYVFVVLVACVAGLFIGIGLYQMYRPPDRDNAAYREFPHEQRAYMRKLRQQNQNRLALVARRPDLIIPIS